jgi:hypothetical protein
MIWALVIATTINGPGIDAAQFESREQCRRAALIIGEMAYRTAVERGGDEEAADIYARCEKRE